MDDARRQRTALARWEGEGGALGPSTEANQTLDETELRILARLGAAALLEWHTLPTEMQTAIFLRAKALRAVTDSARVKNEIIRLLRERDER